MLAGSASVDSTLPQLTLTDFISSGFGDVTVDGASGETRFFLGIDSLFVEEPLYEGFGGIASETLWTFRNTGGGTIDFQEGDLELDLHFDISFAPSFFNGTYQASFAFFEFVTDIVLLSPSLQGSDIAGFGSYSYNSFNGSTTTVNVDAGTAPAPVIVQNDQTGFDWLFQNRAFSLAPGDTLPVSQRIRGNLNVQSETPFALAGVIGLAEIDGRNTATLGISLPDEVAFASTVAGLRPTFVTETTVNIITLPAPILLLLSGALALTGLGVRARRTA